jgi:hypothetical protein
MKPEVSVWPKHNYAWVVLSPYGHLMRDNGSGYFYDGGFGEVFLDKRAALWVRNDNRKNCLSLASHAPVTPPLNARNTTTRDEWKKLARSYKVLKIALPGTYPQFRPPGQLERDFVRSLFSERGASRNKE